MDIERTPVAQEHFSKTTKGVNKTSKDVNKTSKDDLWSKTEINVIDGVDGFTPEMLRVRKK